MATRTDILTILRREKELLTREYHVSDLALFGSQARGDATESSDIDVLVKFEGPVPLEVKEAAREHLKVTLETAFRRKVEVIDEDTIFMPIIRKIIKSGAL